MNDPRSICKNCGHVRALHRRRSPRDVAGVAICGAVCKCSQFVDAATQGDPVCLACKTGEAVETVTLASSSGDMLAEIHLCHHHRCVYAYHVARVLGDLLKGRLSIP